MSILVDDLNHIVTHTEHLWPKLRNQRIFITGGTGFFGCWLLESLIWANRKYDLNITAVILTRNIERFSRSYPHLANNPALCFWEGDIKSYSFPKVQFSYIIHAATDSTSRLNKIDPLLIWETIVEGTKGILEFAIHSKVKHFLFISSGAVYEKQATNLSNISENDLCQSPNNQPASVYALGKLTAEYLCQLYAKQYALNVKIARCFAFIGPYFPLDEHFALGNFIRDGIKANPIVVNSDGTSYRSYLYAADLMIWLWTILLREDTSTIYNVGSDKAYSIAQIANIVAKNLGSKSEVKIMSLPQAGIIPERYIPNINRAGIELGLKQYIGLDAAIKKTANWYVHTNNTVSG